MDFFNKWKNDQGGFSLVELIIVLLLIVIIIVVIVCVRSCGNDADNTVGAINTFSKSVGLI